MLFISFLIFHVGVVIDKICRHVEQLCGQQKVQNWILKQHSDGLMFSGGFVYKLSRLQHREANFGRKKLRNV